MKKKRIDTDRIDDVHYHRVCDFIIDLKVTDDTKKIVRELFDILIYIQKHKVPTSFLAATFAGMTSIKYFDNDLFYKLIYALKEENHDGVANALEHDYKIGLDLIN